MTEEKQITAKPKPQYTTVAIAGEVSERLEVFCRKNHILRKEFVDLALAFFERTDYDIKGDSVDISPIERAVSQLSSITEAMKIEQRNDELKSELLQARQELEVYKAQSEAELHRLKEWQKKATDELERISNEQPFFGKMQIKMPW